MSPSIIELLIVFGVLFWIYKLATIKVHKKDRQYNAEDTEIIQELHRGMEKMAVRMEALETILLDQGAHYRRTPPPMPDHENEQVR